VRRILAAAVLVLCAAGAAAAHAYLERSVPQEGARLDRAPRVVRLVFTEPVELRFSLFKVYRLEATPDAPMARLNALAAALFNEALQACNDDDRRVDRGIANRERVTREVVIWLKPDLWPGPYVVVWRVLSVDTHITRGFFVFVVPTP